MASVTGDFTLALKIVLVDGHHHLHHLARNLFGLLVILIEVILHMTERALHSQ